MPSIIIKDEYGTPETFLNVNTVKFETPEGGYASFRYNEGSNYPVPTDGYRIRFIDYDGLVLREIYVDEGETVDFPPDPVREGLVFQGWNYTAEQLAYITHNVDVGAIYAATQEGEEAVTDVTTLHIDSSLTTGSVSLRWVWNGSVGTRKLLIDWGDGSAVISSTSASASHSYAEAGEYDITITVENPSGGIDYKLGTTSTSSSSSQQLNGTLISAVLGSNADLYNRAFYNCYRLQNVTLHNAVTSIPNYAFYTCYCLQGINIPGIVTSISDRAFMNCHSLQNISIPAGVTSIERNAFYECISLQNINIPSSVVSIGGEAFRYCYNLQNINIPEGVTSIGSYLIQNGYSLQNISLPEGVTSIDASSFGGCIALRMVSIPESVTSIGDNAFSGCKPMYFAVAATTPPTLGSGNSLIDTVYNSKIIVPVGCADAYKAAANWSSYAAYIVESPY